MEAIISKEESYTLEIDGKKHIGFKKESEWHGLMRLIQPNGATIIIHKPNNILQIFCDAIDKPVKVEVVSFLSLFCPLEDTKEPVVKNVDKTEPIIIENT